MSSLNIPMVSNVSLSVLSNGTPRANTSNRKSINFPRNVQCTPSLLLKHKQKLSANLDLAERRNQTKRHTFSPPLASTPIQSQRKKNALFEALSGPAQAQNELIDSLSNARESNEHDTLTKNKTNRTLTQSRQIDDSNERTLVPETQAPNESVIPETQDDYIPETQEEERIPETQESYTQDYAITDPVQAQVNYFLRVNFGRSFIRSKFFFKLIRTF